MDIIEERQRLKKNMCTKHLHQIKDIFCLTDNSVICAYCGISENHSGHQMKTLEELENQSVAKIKRLEELVQEFSKYPEEISQIFEKPRKNLEHLITEVFWQISNMLSKQKALLLMKVQQLYNPQEYEKDYMKAYVQHSDVMTELKERIEQLKDKSFNEGFMEALDSSEPMTPLKLESEKLKMKYQDLHLHFSRQIEKFSQGIIDKIQEMSCINLKKVSSSLDMKAAKKDFCLPINPELFEEIKTDTESGFDIFFPKLSGSKTKEKRSLVFNDFEIDNKVYSEYLR